MYVNTANTGLQHRGTSSATLSLMASSRARPFIIAPLPHVLTNREAIRYLLGVPTTRKDILEGNTLAWLTSRSLGFIKSNGHLILNIQHSNNRTTMQEFGYASRLLTGSML